MSEWVDSLHWSTAIAFFWAGGIIRTSTIFAIGWYGAQRGSRYHAVNKLMASPLYLKTQQFVHRWGALAVPLCFFTWGFQTAVIMTTGITHMPLRRWIPAMLVGTLIWGIIYATIGMAVLWAWAQKPWLPPLVLILLAGIIWQIRKRTRD